MLPLEYWMQTTHIARSRKSWTHKVLRLRIHDPIHGDKLTTPYSVGVANITTNRRAHNQVGQR